MKKVNKPRMAYLASSSLLLMTLLAIGGQLLLAPLLSEPARFTDTLAIRFGILLFAVIVILDLMVAWSLYYLFEDHRSPILNFSLLLRALYAVVLLVALAPLLLTLAEPFSGSIPLLVDSFNTAWMLGLGLFGLHLFLLGSALCESGILHKSIPAVLALAGLGYLIDTLSSIMGYHTSAALYTFWGELVFMGWLLFAAGKKFKEPSNV